MDTGPSIQRIYLECTASHSSTLNTGIQRVVRNLCRHGSLVGAEFGVECIPILCAAGRLFAVSWRPNHCFQRDSFSALGSALRRWLRSGWVRLHKVFFPRTLVRHARSLLWRWQGRELRPGPGDLILLVDGTWWQRDLNATLSRAKQRGARVGVLVYDLIPLSHPQFNTPWFVTLYRRWLDDLVEIADFFIAISETTRDRLQGYLQEEHPGRDWQRVPFPVFRLGCTIGLGARNEEVRDEVKAVFDDRGQPAPYLTVGTLEPRKNHQLILDAFDQVWQAAPRTRLCLVGKIGWLCEDIRRRVRQHSRLGESLFVFHDLTDGELQYCYRHARALVHASHVEGFGLPIVEALQHRLRVLVSDIPIHREVGKDFCAYFDVHNAEALARLVLDLELQGRFPPVRRPEEFELPNWEASSGEFLERCLNAVRSLDRGGQGVTDVPEKAAV